MFDFLNMLNADPYEFRMVDRTETPNGFISTCRVTDGAKPFETAVMDSRYLYDGKPNEADAMIIAETYDSAEDAKIGHERWRDLMLATEPPAKITDCNNGFSGVLGIEACYTLPTKEN